MNRLTPLLMCLLWCGVARAQSEPLPVSYVLDPAVSHLAVVIRYDRKALMKGHDHVAKAMTFEGQVVWSAGDLSQCQIQVTVPVSSLKIDPPGLRAKLGLSGETKASTIAKIEANMAGSGVLEALRFPDISFRASSCRAQGDQVVVTGQLRLHGISAEVTPLMTVTADGRRFHATGTLDLQHRDFGMSPFSALMGAIRNDPGLTLHLDVSGVAR